MLAGAHKKFYRIQHPEIYLLDLKVQYKYKIKLPPDMVSKRRARVKFESREKPHLSTFINFQPVCGLYTLLDLRLFTSNNIHLVEIYML